MILLPKEADTGIDEKRTEDEMTKCRVPSKIQRPQ